MGSTNLLSVLQTSELFKDLDERDFYLLIHHGKLRLFQEGQSIYRRDEHSRGMFCIIISGRVGIIAENDQLIKDMGQGEILGEIGVTSRHKKRMATVEALQPTEVFEWNTQVIQEQVPDLMERLKILARKNVPDYDE